MRFLSFATASCISAVTATILQNGQIRPNNYPDTTVSTISSYNSSWQTYAPSAPEISYKGRWDDKYISWWSAPGLKFGFQAQQIAISFGNYTSDGVLIAYRIDGQDWMLTNVTANSTHLLVTPSTAGFNLTTPQGALQSLELRVTNWAYGVQINCIHVSGGPARLVKVPEYTRTMELIGDSLSAGQYATLEGISSYSWGLMYGLGDVEFSITAYPGICLHDSRCYGNLHGQTLQWLKIPDTSGRALDIYGSDPAGIPDWNFTAHAAADITVINIGTNDNNTANNITSAEYYTSYIQLIDEIHARWPKSQIVVLSLWSGFSQVGNTWAQGAGFLDEIQNVVKHFNNGSLNQRGECTSCFVYYFNTTGILEHNDIGPQYHPTDVGHVKLASHLMMYVKLVFGWDLRQTGPEVQHDTLYWNDQSSY
ncbi:hypothetical protein LTR78_001973 [Recurvomyces mirabilis]|uniref:SGNH hydrolase-type esterase domain-containing protein n=1 Tax=Recurvomyces mirabilis TaxID=574656 RepID=A0AAE0WU73_9PEZI|nr:hypothetical protein LTR78_001973 [Recurvomyces mirabilis]KAK5160431.1 hypothetical protein LTS14_001443 [Recurvomyces mirabilis]